MNESMIEQRQMAELESACIQKDEEIQALKKSFFKAMDIAAGLTNHTLMMKINGLSFQISRRARF
jgi:hypothetical protein